MLILRYRKILLKLYLSTFVKVVNRKFTKLAQHLRYIIAYIDGLTSYSRLSIYLQQFVEVLAIIHRVFFKGDLNGSSS